VHNILYKYENRIDLAPDTLKWWSVVITWLVVRFFFKSRINCGPIIAEESRCTKQQVKTNFALSILCRERSHLLTVHPSRSHASDEVHTPSLVV